MILQGQKKRILKEIIRYYVTTTNKKYTDFITDVEESGQKPLATLEYSQWLALHAYQKLKENGITIPDIIENKDVINSAINSESSRNEGEFYTPEVWAKDGRQYLKDILGDQWGKVNVWDASCGTGNLMRTENYPKDKLFLSSLLPEDTKVINATPEYEGVTAFELDFLNGIDYNSAVTEFSDNLPENLRKKLEANEPFVFYMNPPYKTGVADRTDVGAVMSNIGMKKSALNLFHQFIYRVFMVKKFYNLTDVYLGLFGPITMFHSETVADLYNELKENFQFGGGFCFDATDFSGTSESVGWIVGYTTWKPKKDGDVDLDVRLTAKAVDSDDNILEIGERLVTDIDTQMHDWIDPVGVGVRDKNMPFVTMYRNFDTNQQLLTPREALGFIMSSNFVIRGTRRACVSSIPTKDSTPIVVENFERCLASFGVRRVYSYRQTSFNSCQYYSAPDVNKEGYQEFLYNLLPIYLFDTSTQFASYRNQKTYTSDGVEDIKNPNNNWTSINRMFPLSEEEVRSIVTDENILKDINEHTAENSFILEKIQEYKPHFYNESKELFDFCCNIIRDSLKGNKRADFSYTNNLLAWDAGIVQIRDVEGFLSEEDTRTYLDLLKNLKKRLYSEIYKYGFLMDSSHPLTDGDDEEVVDAVPSV